MSEEEISWKKDAWYYYEHTDGSIHRKPAIVVEMGGGPRDYFDSPFVKRWWRQEPDATARGEE